MRKVGLMGRNVALLRPVLEESARLFDLPEHRPRELFAQPVGAGVRVGLDLDSHGFEKRLWAMACTDTRTRLLMTTPGVGVVMALTFVTAIDDPSRFTSSKTVGDLPCCCYSGRVGAPVRGCGPSKPQSALSLLPAAGSNCKSPFMNPEAKDHSAVQKIYGTDLERLATPPGQLREAI
jgi:Transposase IS116/IS110/IS902 family